MKERSLVAAAIIGVMFLLAFGIKAEAAELKVLSAFGMQSVLEDLGPKLERATGHKLALAFATGGATVKRVQDGEAADVVITTQPGISSIVKDGKAVAGNVTVLARAGIFVAVFGGHHDRRQGHSRGEGAGRFPAHAGGGSRNQGEGHGACCAVMATTVVHRASLS